MSGIFGGFFESQAVGDLDLTAGDGDAGDGAALFAGEVAGRAAYAAADVEDGGVRGDLGDFEQQVDQVDLGDVFGLGGVEPVAVVDVLAPK